MPDDAWWRKVDEECSVARDKDASPPRALAMFNVEQKRRQTSNRSTAVPMDFEFTHRASSNIKPVWTADDPFHVSQKRMTHHFPPFKLTRTPLATGNYDEANPPPSPFPPQNATPEHPFIPTSEPYLFPTPGPHTVFPPRWQPPPPHVKNREIVDVDMNEISPNIPKTQQHTQEDTPSKPESESRVVALGGIRRVFRSRYGAATSKQYNLDAEDADEESVNSEDEEQSDREGQMVKPTKSTTTNNHYTLNLASNTPTAEPNIPYTLSGSVHWPPLFVCR